MFTTLMMSVKTDTLGFSKMKVFWNKGYDMISAYDVTTKFHNVTQIIL